MLSPDARATDYADKRFRKLDQRVVHALESRLALRYLDELTQAGSSVLDMPAGCGRFIEPLLKRDMAVTAGDCKQARLDVLAARAPGEVTVRHLRGEALPFEDGSFAAGICIRLLQHLHERSERRAVLAELARVTREGVVATVYMHSRAHHLVHSLRRQKRLVRYERAMLESDVAAAGLRVRRMARPIPLHAQTVLQLVPL